MTISAPADKRFKRATVRPGHRSIFPRFLRWRVVLFAILAVVAGYSGYRGVTLVAQGRMFRVSHVIVRGNSRLSNGEVLAMVPGLRSESTLAVSLPAYRARLMESPWVADATLRRVLPSTVEITVQERAPIGLCRIAEHLYLVDGSGAIIDEYGPQYGDFDLPIIDGLATTNTAGHAPNEGGQAHVPVPLIDPWRAELAARVVRSLSTHKALARRVSQIDVRDVHDAVLLVEGDSALLHVGDTQFAERLQSYLDLAPALRSRVPDIDYVDLRFDERVYVRPAGTSGRKK
ncbi:MAG TPA: FtsQ-type POTRA domain-containing protein [Coriobacteriia bacterium]